MLRILQHQHSLIPMQTHFLFIFYLYFTKIFYSTNYVLGPRLRAIQMFINLILTTNLGVW